MVSYTLVGNGRVAKHMAHYFQHLNITFNQWSRLSEIPLDALVRNSERVLLLISDAAITDFVKQNPCLQTKMVVHFSGALVVDGLLAAHPLVSFSHDLFDMEFYKTIPFCIAAEGAEFAEILPGLPNTCFRIPCEQKALYHALCVLSGNFTTILWQKFFAELKQQWDVPHEIAMPYLQSIMKNLQKNSVGVLTGPLARGDQITIEKNLAALGDDPYAKIYEAFVGVYLNNK